MGLAASSPGLLILFEMGGKRLENRSVGRFAIGEINGLEKWLDKFQE